MQYNPVTEEVLTALREALGAVCKNRSAGPIRL